MCSNRADLLKSAGRNSPPPQFCRFPQMCHQKYPPHLADFFKSGTAEFLKSVSRNKHPPFADLLKSAIADLLKCVSRNTAQLADCLESATADLLKSIGRNTPQFFRFAHICHYRFPQICLQKSPFSQRSDIWWKFFKFYFCMYCPMMHASLP